jgi:predicted nucleic acid-binding protein
MNVLLDTNILTRLAQSTHPQHPMAQAAILALQQQGHTLCIAPQNLYEFWAVATRPIAAANGLGLSVQETSAEIDRSKALFRFLPDSPAIYPEWEDLVRRLDVKGKVAHDARLVAAMKVHGITHVLTFNAPDFSRFAGLTILSPDTLAGSSTGNIMP